MENIIKTEIEVNSEKIRILRVGEIEYISLTDLARYYNPEEPKVPIQTWMRNKDVILYLGLWEKLNNKNFKGHEFTTFENKAGRNSFYKKRRAAERAFAARSRRAYAAQKRGTYRAAATFAVCSKIRTSRDDAA